MQPGYEGSGPQALEILPSGKKNAFVQRKLVTDRYTQQTDTYYLSVASANEVAYTLISQNSFETIATTVLGIVLGSKTGYLSVVYSAATMISTLSNQATSSDIKKLTANNQKVRITTCRSSVGTLKNVKWWGSNAIEITCTNSNTVKETIVNKKLY